MTISELIVSLVLGVIIGVALYRFYKLYNITNAKKELKNVWWFIIHTYDKLLVDEKDEDVRVDFLASYGAYQDVLKRVAEMINIFDLGLKYSGDNVSSVLKNYDYNKMQSMLKYWADTLQEIEKRL